MNTLQLIELAELALAGYGQFSSEGPPSTDDLQNLNGDPHGFSKLQADRFATQFNVAFPTFNDAFSSGGSRTTSFDATVFIRRAGPGASKIFIAFRGVAQKDPLDITSDLQAVNQIVQAWRHISGHPDPEHEPYRYRWKDDPPVARHEHHGRDQDRAAPRVIEYLLSPIQRAGNESLRER